MAVDHHRSEEMLHRLDRVRAQMRELRAAVTERLQALSVDGESADGAVRLTVDTDGVLTSLHLDDRLQGSPPAHIANEVLRAYTSAQQRAARETAEVLEPLGETDYVLDRLRWRQAYTPPLQHEHGESTHVQQESTRRVGRGYGETDELDDDEGYEFHMEPLPQRRGKGT